ncbi:MAG: right-handed parallel beta-helix repeat-containing protein, partial [Dehalococcoidales bacterium]
TTTPTTTTPTTTTPTTTTPTTTTPTTTTPTTTTPVEEVSLVITDIKVTYAHDTNANIGWTTNILSNSQIEYGPTPAYGFQTILDETLVTEHSVMLIGLDPETTYYFRVKSADSIGNTTQSDTFMFTTSKRIIEVSGFISVDSIWESAYNYLVTEDVLLSQGTTLTIEPGVIIKFSNETGLYIDGTLKAIGTESDPIIFTSAQNVPSGLDWGPIYFTEMSEKAQLDESGNYVNGSILKYAVVEYGGWGIYGNEGALVIESSSPLIEYNTFTNNGKLGISRSSYGIVKIWKNGPSATNAQPIFRYNTLNNNYASQILQITRSDDVIIEYNTICNNEGAAIGAHSCNNIIISNNLVSENAGGSGSGGATGITCYNSSGIIQFNQIISNSSVGLSGISDYAALYVQASLSENRLVEVVSNQITGNYSYYDGSGPSGIVAISTKCLVFKNNTVTDNIVESELPELPEFQYQKSIINIGDRDNIQFEFTENNIYNNEAPYIIRIVAGSPYNEVDLSNNYWGTTDESLINSWVYDFYDDYNCSKVIFQPVSASLI